MRSDWLIIGIAGATCSGKTTLSRKLHQSLKNSILINQDDYFLAIDDPRHELIPDLNHLNWELLSAMDMDKMIDDVEKLISEPSRNSDDPNEPFDKRILIMDGFLLFNCKKLADMCDLRFFLDMTRDQCWQRRKCRVYDPPDVTNYFDKIVWPEYTKNRLKILANDDFTDSIVFMDGSQSVDHNFRIIREAIELRLNTCLK